MPQQCHQLLFFLLQSIHVKNSNDRNFYYRIIHRNCQCLSAFAVKNLHLIFVTTPKVYLSSEQLELELIVSFFNSNQPLLPQ